MKTFYLNTFSINEMAPPKNSQNFSANFYQDHPSYFHDSFLYDMEFLSKDKYDFTF